jgi:restriction endonuclease Mrr
VVQPSRNIGYDILAHALLHEGDDDRTVVEVKRYRTPITVEAVQALLGVMMHEHATHGMLVTTSNFTDASRAFIQGKRIALIDGPLLVELLNKFLGLRVHLEYKTQPARQDQPPPDNID